MNQKTAKALRKIAKNMATEPFGYFYVMNSNRKILDKHISEKSDIQSLGTRELVNGCARQIYQQLKKGIIK
jgi:hypothetical protein